ncbi:MAG: DUF4388 domain-containing protein [Candidatus Eisenbacteria bacterium]|nr:DUF4388 domain-containing protein [Candidatus Eisenbacteria bacterium]
MGLRGSLSDIGPVEAIQMMALQNRTGCLTIRAGGEKISIDFVAGAILAAHPRRLGGRSSLLGLFEELEIIEPRQLRRWTELCDHSDTDPIDILAQLGVLDSDELQELYGIYLDAQIGRVLRQNRGRFHFQSTNRGRQVAALEPRSADALLLEGLRRRDEVEDLFSGPLPPEAVPVLLERGPEKNPSDPQALEERKRRAVHRHCDGRWPLRQILERCSLPEYDIATILARDLEEAKVNLVGDPARTIALPEPREGWARRWILAAVGGSALGLLILALRVGLDVLPAPRIQREMPLSPRGEAEMVRMEQETVQEARELVIHAKENNASVLSFSNPPRTAGSKGGEPVVENAERTGSGGPRVESPHGSKPTGQDSGRRTTGNAESSLSRDRESSPSHDRDPGLRVTESAARSESTPPPLEGRPESES